jgi:hypothetical protein
MKEERVIRERSKASRQGEQHKGELSQGEKPQRHIPFTIDFKGGDIETLMRIDDHTGSMCISMNKCFHQCWCFHLLVTEVTLGLLAGAEPDAHHFFMSR